MLSGHKLLKFLLILEGFYFLLEHNFAGSNIPDGNYLLLGLEIYHFMLSWLLEFLLSGLM
jgi:hypothetical protein